MRVSTPLQIMIVTIVAATSLVAAGCSSGSRTAADVSPVSSGARPEAGSSEETGDASSAQGPVFVRPDAIQGFSTEGDPVIVEVDTSDPQYCVPDLLMYNNTAIRLTSDTVVATEHHEEGDVVRRFVGTVPETVGNDRAEDWLSSNYFRYGPAYRDPIPESAREKMEDGADVWMLAWFTEPAGSLTEPAGALFVGALLAVTKNGPSQLLNRCVCPTMGDSALLSDNGPSQVPDAQVPDGCPRQWVAVPELDRAAETVSLVEGRSVVEALVDKSHEQHQALLEAMEKEYEQPIIEPTPWTELSPDNRSLLAPDLPADVASRVEPAGFELALGDALWQIVADATTKLESGETHAILRYALCPRQPSAFAGYCVSFSGLARGEVFFGFPSLADEDIEIVLVDETDTAYSKPMATFSRDAIPGRLTIDTSSDTNLNDVLTKSDLEEVTDALSLTLADARYASQDERSAAGIQAVGGLTDPVGA